MPLPQDAIVVTISELEMSCSIQPSLVFSECSPLFVRVRLCLSLGQELKCRTRELAQWVKTPSATPGDLSSLSSVLKARMVEGEN